MPAYISEFSFYGRSDTEFVEVAVPAGTNVSSYMVYFYAADGTIYNSFSLGSSVATMHGHDIYLIDDSDPSFDTTDPTGQFYPDDAIALYDGSSVVQFVSWMGNTVSATNGPAVGTTSIDVGTTAGMGNSLQSDNGGVTYYEQASLNQGSIPACYAPGTQIDTPHGWRAVESLRAGDHIRDAQTGRAHVVFWVWRDTEALDGSGLPILIAKDAFCTDWPFADLIVSPQHRLALASSEFAPAKALTRLKGVREMRGKREILWYHFACKAHHVVRANGIDSESLLLGPMILQSLPKRARLELAGLYGAAQDSKPLNGPAALPCLSVRHARQRVAELSAPFEQPAQNTTNDAAARGPLKLPHHLLGQRFAKAVPLGAARR